MATGARAALTTYVTSDAALAIFRGASGAAFSVMAARHGGARRDAVDGFEANTRAMETDEMNNERKPITTETAEDHWQGDELAEHFEKPWAMVGRVCAPVREGGGEPAGPEHGELIVRLPNWPRDMGAMASAIDVAIGYPFLPMSERGKGVQAFAGVELSSDSARALARVLDRAADLVEGKS